MMKKNTYEPQYEDLYEVLENHGRAEFGIMANQSWNDDPKRTLFTLSRYKFVAKMLNNKNHALEIGCADAFGTRLVQQTVKKVTASDIDPLFISDAKERMNKLWPLDLEIHDFVKEPLLKNQYDCGYSLDVLEHIDKENEDAFIRNIKSSLVENSPLIIGIPSTESQKYASKQSKIGHVNCKTGEELKVFLENHYKNVFIFSMNDEVVHTGFFRMSNYLFALCV